MSETIDARGLSCPQPVLLTLNRLATAAAGALTIQVDTEASRENVCRAAQSKGWTVDGVTEEGGEYRISIRKE